MPCDVCDHTLQNVGIPSDKGDRIFWCPRCGTLVAESPSGHFRSTEIPLLARRVRDMTPRVDLAGHRAVVSCTRSEWLGIVEAAGIYKG